MCVLVWCPKRQPAASSANPSGKERDQEITRDLPLMEPAVAFEISHSSSDPWIHVPCYLEKQKT